MSLNLKGKSKLIAITTYFNPCLYSNRIKNFRIFRSHLAVPLMAVELSFTGNFELKDGDADYLYRLNGDTVIWQKERLLNTLIDHIPEEYDYVAWLDCDVIISAKDWPDQAIQKLKDHQLVQLFSNFVDLPNGDFFFENNESSFAERSGYAISFLKAAAMDSAEDFRPLTSGRLRKAAFGLAWASTVSLLKKYGFYDAMIIGSGDRALACAAFGQFEDLLFVGKMNEHRSHHYLQWAIPFHNEVKHNVGYLDTTLYHLWHGEISDRNYVQRHEAFSKFDFNPSLDLVIAENGCWSLKKRDPEMEKFFIDYFYARKEDGIES
ncbi:MAG: hypothetical protein J7502_19245 [Flavisolibacter sp.]|nr:hypothetical protein [Flavisolibacter sp.]